MSFPAVPVAKRPRIGITNAQRRLYVPGIIHLARRRLLRMHLLGGTLNTDIL